MVDRYPEYNARHHDAASHLAAEVGIGILTLEWYPPLESDDEAHVCTLLHSLMLEVHVPAVLLPSQVTGQLLRLVTELLQLHRMLRACTLHLPHLRFGDRPGQRAKGLATCRHRADNGL